MKMFDINLFLMLFLISCLIYCFIYKHILLVLLSLEFMVMNLMVEVYFIYGIHVMNCVSVYYLILGVCESILGVTILVMMIRYKGNDYINSILVVKW